MATDDAPPLGDVLSAVGPRLRALRQQRGATLTQLAQTTGISVSTLSRLESGQRKPTLELLFPLARAHQVPLAQVRENPAHLAMLESWLRSYRPDELFDAEGAPTTDRNNPVACCG